MAKQQKNVYEQAHEQYIYIYIYKTGSWTMKLDNKQPESRLVYGVGISLIRDWKIKLYLTKHLINWEYGLLVQTKWDW